MCARAASRSVLRSSAVLGAGAGRERAAGEEAVGRNRRELARCQWQLSLALIDRHRPHHLGLHPGVGHRLGKVDLGAGSGLELVRRTELEPGQHAPAGEDGGKEGAQGRDAGENGRAERSEGGEATSPTVTSTLERAHAASIPEPINPPPMTPTRMGGDAISRSDHDSARPNQPRGGATQKRRAAKRLPRRRARHPRRRAARPPGPRPRPRLRARSRPPPRSGIAREGSGTRDGCSCRSCSGRAP